MPGSARGRLAILSMHTSPLAQPGTGDGGGMNVYVRELATALARSGVECDVFTRAEDPNARAVVAVEPGFRVHHIKAGPVAPALKESLPDLVEEWATGVGDRLRLWAARGVGVDAVHANYWLSGIAGHRLKHELGIPLLVTFHTLDRVKADAGLDDVSFAGPLLRAQREAEIVGCADSVLASCQVEADQLIDLYDADPGRIAIVAPGVEHAFFGPGNRQQARRAIGLPAGDPLILFVGRIQPLKGAALAVRALSALRLSAARSKRPAAAQSSGRAAGGSTGGSGSPAAVGPLAVARLAVARLAMIGGPSGRQGRDEIEAVQRAVTECRLEGAVRMFPAQSHEMLSTYFRAADACIVPSHSESFGLVALEAAACGTPVVAAAVGGLTTIVDDGRTGFLVEGRDPEDFATPLAEILSDPERAASMGRQAAASARAYSWDRAAEALWRRVGEVTARELVACG